MKLTGTTEVEVSGSWILLDIGTWFVGGDGGTVTESIGNVVDSSDTTIGITETV